MPTADGRFRGISLAGLRIPWLEPSAEDWADALCGCEHGPCDLCVESDGVCQRGDDCQCKGGEKAQPGW